MAGMMAWVMLDMRLASGEPQDQGQPSSASSPRGYAGMTVDDREDRGRGVRVVGVTPNGPADQAGLKPGDLIVRLGDVRIREMVDLAAILELLLPGQTVELEVLRGSQRIGLTITLGQRPAGLPEPSFPPAEQPSKVPGFSESPPPSLPGPREKGEPSDKETAIPKDAQVLRDKQTEGALMPQLPSARDKAPVGPIEPTLSLNELQAQIELLRVQLRQLEQRIERLESLLKEKLSVGKPDPSEQ